MALTFPGESAAYRAARNELLKKEVELRRAIESVAAERRRLPPGGPLAENYLFEECLASGTKRQVHFAELFGSKPSLAIYSYMFGPEKASRATCAPRLSMASTA